MGSTLVSSPIIVQQQQQTADDLLFNSISSALNQRNKMSTSMGTGNRRKQKHSSMWMNSEDYMTMPVSQSSSSNNSPSSDMTLPTPPRSPSAEIGFDDTMNGYEDDEEYSASQGIPEPLLDDLLELWCEEADFPSTGDGSEEISISNALTELGFDSIVSNDGDGHNDTMSETEHAESMIDHLLANCKASYLSPPPTNPSSPKMQADSEFEETFVLSSVKSEVSDSSSSSVSEEIEEEVITAEDIEDESKYGMDQIKMEETDDDMILPHQDEVLQNLIDCSEGMMNFEIDEQLLDNMDKFDDAFNPLQAISETSNSAAKSVEKFIESLKTEPIDNDEEGVNGESILVEDESYDLFGEPKSKKGRYDFDEDFLTEFSSDIKQDCMWNGFLGGDMNLTPSAMLGGSSWKQEYTFETLFEEKELEVKTEGTTSGATPASSSAAPVAEVKLEFVAQKESKDDIEARLAAEEDEKKKKELEHFKIAFDNDHGYALTYDSRYMKDIANKSKTMSASSPQSRKVIQGIIVKSNPQAEKASGGATQKKTKILVPLKDLMETLQQKSFLVSPLGPNKKIIRFTGSDSVKGVLSTANFQSAVMASQQGSGSRTITTVPSKPNHNVRKRPHTLKSPKIEITQALSPLDLDMESSSSSLLSSSIVSSSTGSSSPNSSCSNSTSATSTKKKTKAHNNMERMRRIDLRNSFDNLKKLVPPLAKIPKCSKVEILRRAEEYIKGLRNQEKRLTKEEMQVRARNAQLRSRLEALSSSMNMPSSINSSSISCSN